MTTVAQVHMLRRMPTPGDHRRSRTIPPLARPMAPPITAAGRSSFITANQAVQVDRDAAALFIIIVGAVVS